MNLKPQHLTAFLPATPCTPEMRERIITIAKHEHVSIAQVQRAALSLFLSTSDNKLIIDSKKEEQS